jgi:putative hydrolase of HD superfamily
LTTISRHTTEKVIELAQLCLRFGRVNRVTYHEDGKRFETDTDHTVMLAVIACAFAAQHNPFLDVGRVAQFAIVHDLVKAYAGDANTLAVGAVQASAKEAREAAALDRIRREFTADFPWLTDTIDAYESLAQPEARFVKALDKVLPKVTHILNRGAALREHGVDASNIDAVNGSQVAKMQASYAADQPAVMSLYADVHTLLRETLEKQHAIANERFLDGLPSERLRQVWSKWEARHGTVYIFDGEFYRCDFAASDKSISIASAYAFRPLGATWAEVEALAAAAAKPEVSMPNTIDCAALNCLGCPECMPEHYRECKHCSYIRVTVDYGTTGKERVANPECPTHGVKAPKP